MTNSQRIDAIHALLLAPFVLTFVVVIVCAVAFTLWAERRPKRNPYLAPFERRSGR